jgi:hypothetical protein
VPQDQRPFSDGNELRPIAISHMQIRMADAARFDLDQYFLRFGMWLRDVFDTQGRFELAKDGCFHCAYLKELGKRDSRISHKRLELL